MHSENMTIQERSAWRESQPQEMDNRGKVSGEEIARAKVVPQKHAWGGQKTSRSLWV